jgi:hypothetical protein
LDRYKIKHALLWLFLIFSILLFIFPGDAQAKNPDGSPDEELNLSNSGTGGGKCGVNCHQTTAGGGISVTFNPSPPYVIDQTGIKISVKTLNVPGDEKKVGIGLYNNATPYPQSIKTDGWIITADPNGNTPTFNYNFNDTFRNGTMNWTVNAPPNSGTYYIMFHVRHGMGSNPKDRNVTSIISLDVNAEVPEFPYGSTLAFSLSTIIYILIRKELE